MPAPIAAAPAVPAAIGIQFRLTANPLAVRALEKLYGMLDFRENPKAMVSPKTDSISGRG